MIISVDSRSVTRPAETVFYALKGQNNDGHDYVERLYGRGVRHFVLSERRPEYETLEGASIRYVDDTLAALQEDAAQYRRQCRAEVTAITGSNGKTVVKEWMTAITGSNGKTVVKEWIAQLLGEDVPLSRSPRSYNSQQLSGGRAAVSSRDCARQPYGIDRGRYVKTGGDGPAARYNTSGHRSVHSSRRCAQ